LQFFAAFCPHTGRAVGRGAPTKSSKYCRDFLREVVLPTWRRGRIHLVLDNLSAHLAPPVQQWAADHSHRIKFHWLPTNSSWLNLIESFLATLQRTALQNTHFQTPRQIEEGLRRGLAYLNCHPKPYVWKRPPS
jgi:transposase